jgi:hypothetical protein
MGIDWQAVREIVAPIVGMVGGIVGLFGGGLGIYYARSLQTTSLQTTFCCSDFVVKKKPRRSNRGRMI